MPDIVATAKATTANSYVTVTEGDTYFGERLNSTTWTGAVTADKEKALIMAARRLEEEEYDGYPTVTGEEGTRQALAFPRAGIYDLDGEYLDDDVVPTFVKHAQMELAIWMLAADRTGDTGLEGFLSVTAGPLAVTPNHARAAGVLPEIVKRLLSPVLNSTSGTVRLEKG